MIGSSPAACPSLPPPVFVAWHAHPGNAGVAAGMNSPADPAESPGPATLSLQHLRADPVWSAPCHSVDDLQTLA